jgi:LysM repeat protein
MSSFRLARLWVTLGLIGVCATGCFPDGDSQLDEQKEPHFLTGKNLASALDYPGAINAFEKALEVNPHSASAHFELAWLYERTADNAAAIYHYERFLKYRPNSDKADLAKAHVNACKMELAKTISALGPLPASAQRDVERMMLENRDLRAQVAQWQAYYASGAGRPPTSGSATPSAGVSHPGPTAAQAESQRASPAPITPIANRAATTPIGRTHTVKERETPSSIARRYGVSLSALLSANPQMRPTRLQPGQVLSIPAS